MISPKNQEEFKSLGIETVRRREAASVWDDGKAREALNRLAMKKPALPEAERMPLGSQQRRR
jgi:hypothetical protein